MPRSRSSTTPGWRLGRRTLNEQFVLHVTCDARARPAAAAEHLERWVEDVSGEPAHIVRCVVAPDRPRAARAPTPRRTADESAARAPGVWRAMALLGPLH